MNLVDSINAMLNLAKTGIDLARSGTDSVAVITDLRERLQLLREQLLDVRELVSALQKEKSDLSERLSEITDFRIKRDDFELKALSTGAIVYVSISSRERKVPVHDPVKDDGQWGNEKPVYFCAHCFERYVRSILQPEELKLGHDIYKCHECGATVLVPNDREAEIEIVPTTTRWPDY